MNTRRLRERLRKLWDENPHCHWCNRATILCLVPPGAYCRPFHNRATIDHLNSRLSENRGKEEGTQTVLSCWKCNNERSKEEQSKLPIEELRRRSKGHESKKIRKKQEAIRKTKGKKNDLSEQL